MAKFITLSVLALVFGTGFASAQTGDVNSLCEQALAAMKAGQHKQAQAYLVEAVKLAPNNETVVTALAVVSNNAGDFETAIVAGVHVLQKLNDKNAVAYREVGYAYAVKSAQARKAGNSSQAHEFAELATKLLV